MLIYTTIHFLTRNFRLIATLSLMLASAAGVSAQEGRIDIGKRRASAGEVMNLIESQGRYRFTYNQNDLDTAKIYIFPHTELSIKDALYSIVKNTRLGYVVRNRHIAFVPVNGPSVITEKPAPKKITRNAVPEGGIRLPIGTKKEDWTDAVVPITILFRFDSPVVDREFMYNDAGLNKLHAILTDPELLSRLDSIVIHAHSSPDGSPGHNSDLSRRRAKSLETYILQNYPYAGRLIIRTYSQLEGYWDRLLEIVEKNPNIPGRDELRALIENPYLSDADKSARFNYINEGRTFAYLRDNFYLRSIRTGTTINFFYASPSPQDAPEPVTEPAVKTQPVPEPVVKPQPVEPAAEPVPVAEPVSVAEPLPAEPKPAEPIPAEPKPAEPIPAEPKSVTEPVTAPEQVVVTVSEPQPQPEPLPESKPSVEVAAAKQVVFRPAVALRTNLLLDIVGGANLGIEIPIGNHFSVSGEFVYAYTRINNLYTLQTTQGTLEARYWFKPRLNALTGWNLGVYGTYCDRFDIQWGRGAQGDGYWSGGLSCGYSFRLSDSFNLDLSMMGGFFYSPQVREYGRPQDGHLIWQKTRYDMSRVSLTMVRANLVWLINKKVAK